MAMSHNGVESWRTDPLYTIPEAAHLAHVSTPTVKRWLFGYQTGASEMPPVFGEADRDDPMVSFLQLAEIIVASAFRHRKIKLEVIRSAHAKAQLETRIEYPFAAVRFESIGGHILRLYDLENGTNFVDVPPENSFEALDAPGNFTLPQIVMETMHTFEYEHELAARWYPVANTKLIVVDPRYSAGIPTIAGRRVSANSVIKRFRAGLSISLIADDLLLTTEDVETIIRYADEIAA